MFSSIQNLMGITRSSFILLICSSLRIFITVLRWLPGQACPHACQPARLLARRSALASSSQRWGVVGIGRRERCRVPASPLACSRAGHFRLARRSQKMCPAVTTYYYIINTSLIQHYFIITSPLLKHYYKLLPFHYYILLHDYFIITTSLLHDYFVITTYYITTYYYRITTSFLHHYVISTS